MVEKLKENIYMSTFPLTGNPLKEINIFVIKDSDHFFIIDTGFNNEENRANMDQLIEELEIDLKKTTLFLTHLHSDHVGLAKYLQDRGVNKTYISETDGWIIDQGLNDDGFQWQSILDNAKMQGLVGDVSSASDLELKDHPGYKNKPEEGFTYTPVKPGDKIDFGDYHFEVIDESGHTPGMVGLLDREKSILFCGDHILGKITPNITYWGEKYGDSLGTYLKNIENLKKENIKTLYSAHRFLIDDVNKRIDELITHHEKRLADTLSIVEKLEKANTTEKTKEMHWDIKVKSWADFPASQKWFAVGEASAHLIHLRDKGEIQEQMIDGVAYYSLS